MVISVEKGVCPEWLAGGVTAGSGHIGDPAGHCRLEHLRLPSLCAFLSLTENCT